MSKEQVDSMMAGITNGASLRDKMADIKENYHALIEEKTQYKSFSPMKSPITPKPKTPKITKTTKTPKTPRTPKCWLKPVKESTQTKVTSKPPAGRHIKKRVRTHTASNTPTVPKDQNAERWPGNSATGMAKSPAENTNSPTTKTRQSQSWKITAAKFPLLPKVQQPNQQSESSSPTTDSATTPKDSPRTPKAKTPKKRSKPPKMGMKVSPKSPEPKTPKTRPRTPVRMGTLALTVAQTHEAKTAVAEEDKENAGVDYGKEVRPYSPYGTENLLHHRTKQNMPKDVNGSGKNEKQILKKHGAASNKSYDKMTKQLKQKHESSASSAGPWCDSCSSDNCLHLSFGGSSDISQTSSQPARRILFPREGSNSSPSQTPKNKSQKTKTKLSIVNDQRSDADGAENQSFTSYRFDGPNQVSDTPRPVQSSTHLVASKRYSDKPTKLDPSFTSTNPRHLECGTTPKSSHSHRSRSKDKVCKKRDTTSCKHKRQNGSKNLSQSSSGDSSVFFNSTITSQNHSDSVTTITSSCSSELNFKPMFPVKQFGGILDGMELKGLDGTDLPTPKKQKSESKVDLLDISVIKTPCPESSNVVLSPRQRLSTNDLRDCINSTLNYPMDSTRKDAPYISPIRGVDGDNCMVVDSSYPASEYTGATSSAVSTDSSEFSFDVDETLTPPAQPPRPQNPAIPTSSMFSSILLSPATPFRDNPGFEATKAFSPVTPARRRTDHPSSRKPRSLRRLAAQRRLEQRVSKEEEQSSGSDTMFSPALSCKPQRPVASRSREIPGVAHYVNEHIHASIMSSDSADSTLVADDTTQIDSQFKAEQEVWEDTTLELDRTQKVGCIGLLKKTRKQRKSTVQTAKPVLKVNPHVLNPDETYPNMPVTSRKHKRTESSSKPKRKHEEKIDTEGTQPAKRHCTRIEPQTFDETRPQNGFNCYGLPINTNFMGSLNKHKRSGSISGSHSKHKHEQKFATESKTHEVQPSEKCATFSAEHLANTPHSQPRSAQTRRRHATKINTARSSNQEPEKRLCTNFGSAKSASTSRSQSKRKMEEKPSYEEQSPKKHHRMRTAAENASENPRRVSQVIRHDPLALHYELDSELNVKNSSDVSTSSISSNLSTAQKRKLVKKMKSHNQSRLAMDLTNIQDFGDL